MTKIDINEFRSKLLKDEKKSIESDINEQVDLNVQNTQQSEINSADDKSVKTTTENNREPSINIHGFDIDLNYLKEVLFATYKDTDLLLYDKLKKSFEILENRENTKMTMKKDFFDRILTLLTIIVLSPIAVIFLFLKFPTDNMLTLVTTIIATFAEVLAGIIVLPNVIAKYLFNKKEDKVYFNLIKDLKDYHSSKIDRFNKKK